MAVQYTYLRVLISICEKHVFCFVVLVVVANGDKQLNQVNRYGYL